MATRYLSLPCPACGAREGQSCIALDGSQRNVKTHSARAAAVRSRPAEAVTKELGSGPPESPDGLPPFEPDPAWPNVRDPYGSPGSHRRVHTVTLDHETSAAPHPNRLADSPSEPRRVHDCPDRSRCACLLSSAQRAFERSVLGPVFDVETRTGTSPAAGLLQNGLDEPEPTAFAYSPSMDYDAEQDAWAAVWSEERCDGWYVDFQGATRPCGRYEGCTHPGCPANQEDS